MVIQVPPGQWEAFAEAYKRVTEAATAKPARLMLERLNSTRPLADAVGFLDNGSGPGTIMSALIENYGTVLPLSCSLTCTDFAPAMANQVNKTRKEAVEKDKQSAWARVDAKVLDALDLVEIQDESQSHVAAGLLYNLTNDPPKCLAECRRVLQTGGVLAASTWAGNDWLEMMKVVPLVKPELRDAVKIKLSTVPTMRLDLEQAGFHSVEIESTVIAVPFESHEGIVDTIMTHNPRLAAICRGLSEADVDHLKQLFLEQVKLFSPEEPGELKGEVLVAVARKE